MDSMNDQGKANFNQYFISQLLNKLIYRDCFWIQVGPKVASKITEKGEEHLSVLQTAKSYLSLCL